MTFSAAAPGLFLALGQRPVWQPAMAGAVTDDEIEGLERHAGMGEVAVVVGGL